MAPEQTHRTLEGIIRTYENQLIKVTVFASRRPSLCSPVSNPSPRCMLPQATPPQSPIRMFRPTFASVSPMRPPATAQPAPAAPPGGSEDNAEAAPDAPRGGAGADEVPWLRGFTFKRLRSYPQDPENIASSPSSDGYGGEAPAGEAEGAGGVVTLADSALEVPLLQSGECSALKRRRL